MSGVMTSSLSLAWSLRKWVILDYEEANGQMNQSCQEKIGPLARNCRWTLLTQLTDLFLWRDSSFLSLFQPLVRENYAAVNLSFSFRTPSISCYVSSKSCLMMEFLLTAAIFFHMPGWVSTIQKMRSYDWWTVSKTKNEKEIAGRWNRRTGRALDRL